MSDTSWRNRTECKVRGLPFCGTRFLAHFVLRDDSLDDESDSAFRCRHTFLIPFMQIWPILYILYSNIRSRYPEANITLRQDQTGPTTKGMPTICYWCIIQTRTWWSAVFHNPYPSMMIQSTHKDKHMSELVLVHQRRDCDPWVVSAPENDARWETFAIADILSD